MKKKYVVRLLIILMLSTGVYQSNIVDSTVYAERWGEGDQEQWNPDDNSEAGDLGNSSGDSGSNRNNTRPTRTRKPSSNSSSNSSSSQSKPASNNSSSSSHSSSSSSTTSNSSSNSSSTSSSYNSSSSNSSSTNTSSTTSSGSTTKSKPKKTAKPKKTKKPKATKRPEKTEKPIENTEEPKESVTTIDFSNIPEEEVESFSLLITAYNEGTEVESMELPDGSICENSITEYQIDKNGTYGVTVNLADGTNYYDEIEITCIKEVVDMSKETEETKKFNPLVLLLLVIPLAIIIVVIRKLSLRKSDLEHERILKDRRRDSDRE